jgi:cellobiose-specific phosphotransferase system component IIA
MCAHLKHILKGHERALSKLKIVKNRLRTSITDDTLSSLLLLAAEQDLMSQLTSDDIITRLVKSHPSLKSHLLF